MKIGGTCRREEENKSGECLAGNYHHFKTISILILNVIEFQRCHNMIRKRDERIEEMREMDFGKT